MEADVGGMERLGFVFAGAHDVDRHLHVGDVALRRPPRGQYGDVDFESPPHVEQVEESTRVAAHRGLEEVADETPVGRRDRGSPTLPDLQQPARRQRTGGLADREPAHAERLRELSLRR